MSRLLEGTETRGAGRSLRQMPPSLVARYDEMYNGTATLVLELEQYMATRDQTKDASAAEAIVTKIYKHLCNGPNSEIDKSRCTHRPTVPDVPLQYEVLTCSCYLTCRVGFLVANGHTILTRILQVSTCPCCCHVAVGCPLLHRPGKESQS